MMTNNLHISLANGSVIGCSNLWLGCEVVARGSE